MQTELQGNDVCVCVRVFVSVCACVCVCRDRERWLPVLFAQTGKLFLFNTQKHKWVEIIFREIYKEHTSARGFSCSCTRTLLSPSCPTNDTLQLSIMCNMCTTLHCKSFCCQLVLIKENLCSWIKASFVLGLSARREFYLNQLQMKLSSPKACAGLRGRRSNCSFFQN